jgi:protein-tyrosine-phosphatase
MLYSYGVVAVAAVLSLAGQASSLQIVGARSSAATIHRTAARMQTAEAVKSSTEVESLLKANSALVETLASVAPDTPELTRLRFALAFPDPAEAKEAMGELLAWRAGAGKPIVEAAEAAVSKAMEGGGWDNEPVRAAAPHAARINEFITPKNILTLATDEGDLVYVIRASNIDDKAMMSKVSVDQLVDFFLYAKEVHRLVVDANSVRTGRLCNVVFANDITGTRKAPDPLFSKALTASSKSFEKLYPSLAGPTMILNLPFILQAFVGLFKPLFPKSVQARLTFDRAPYLSKLNELTPLTTDPTIRKAFLAEVAGLLTSLKGIVAPTRK